MQDYLPHRDQELASWTRGMAKAVSASPESYGVTAAQAAAYDAAQRAYAEALTVATQPQTRTGPAVSRKNTARKTLIALSRRLEGIIQAYPGTTDAMRVDLGLTVRKPRAKMAAVTIERPSVRVVSAMGSRLTLRVGKHGGVGRARPDGARGYTWFYFLGERSPAALGGWSFGGNSIEPTVEVVLEGAEFGAPVWFTANWFNSRMQPGPMSNPVMTRVAGGFAGVVPSAGSGGKTVVSVVAGSAPGTTADPMGLAA
ncbi:hypothetical protein OT109_08445 [Phycisphaeraceae bacterium D3-23]